VFSKFIVLILTKGIIIPDGNEGEGHSWSCGVEDDPQTNLLVISNAALGYGEQDIYNVNIPGRSFRFIIHPATGAPFFIGEKNKCKIEKWSLNKFKIIDENGTCYLFDEYE